MTQINARILGAGKAELVAAGGEPSTVLYGTSEARVRLMVIASPATGARAAISNECAAQAAIHAARRYQCSVIHMPLDRGHGYRLIVWVPNLAMAFA
jgi:hypothetical protein